MLGVFMRTTLDLPETLVSEAMELTKISQKTKLVTIALENLIRKEKIKEIKNYAGKINLDIDIGKMRKR
jgi:Arc/MetJ family transcription regulator